MNRRCGLILALLILSLAVAACGGGSKNKLIYRVEGDTDGAIADFCQVLELSSNPNLRQDAEDQLEALGASP